MVQTRDKGSGRQAQACPWSSHLTEHTATHGLSSIASSRSPRRICLESPPPAFRSCSFQAAALLLSSTASTTCVKAKTIMSGKFEARKAADTAQISLPGPTQHRRTHTVTTRDRAAAWIQSEIDTASSGLVHLVLRASTPCVFCVRGIFLVSMRLSIVWI